MESSERASNYYLSINLLAQKKDRISHSRKDQNKNFSVISKYHVFITFFVQKIPRFASPKNSEQERFSYQ